MAIRSVNISGGFLPTITKECDSSADFSGISNNTIFKNLGDSLIYQKDSNGNITSLFFTGGTISGSLNATGGITGSLSGSATNATSASYALTASYALSSAGGSGITVGTTTITGGTSGRIPFNSGSIYGESANLSWDNTNGRLAIGGIAPNYDFSIMRNAPSTQVGMQISNNGSGIAASDGLFVGIGSDNNAYVQTYDANSLNLGSNTQIALTLSSTNTRFNGLLSNVAANTGAIFQLNGYSSTSGLGFFQLRNNAGTPVLCANENGKVFINLSTVGTAQLHIGAGTATAGSAPLKLTSGTNLTTPEAGAVEYNGTNLFFTPSSTRNILAQISGSTALSTGQILFATTNGYLTSTSNLFWDNTNNRQGILTSTPTSNLQIGGTTAVSGSTLLNWGNWDINIGSSPSLTSGNKTALLLGRKSDSNGDAYIQTATTGTDYGRLFLQYFSVAGSLPTLKGVVVVGDGSDGSNAAKLNVTNGPILVPPVLGSNPNTGGSTYSNGMCYALINPTYPSGIGLDGSYAMWFQSAPTIGTGFKWYHSNTQLMTLTSSGNLGIQTTPTAKLHLAAGSTAANSAPIKINSGTLMTTPEVGAIEYNNTFHVTNSDATRRHIVTAPNTTKVTAGAPYTNDGYIIVNIGGTDFKLMTTA